MFCRLQILCLILLTAPQTVYAADKSDFSKVITFTRQNADSRLEQITAALSSFTKFTKLVQKNSNIKKDYGTPFFDSKRISNNALIVSQFSGEALLDIGNLDWETQNRGFANWPNSIKGFMDYQSYEIAKLKLENAILKKEPTSNIQALEKDVAEKEKYLRAQYMSGDSWAD